jgi:hypothetical protein
MFAGHVCLVKNIQFPIPPDFNQPLTRAEQLLTQFSLQHFPKFFYPMFCSSIRRQSPCIYSGDSGTLFSVQNTVVPSLWSRGSNSDSLARLAAAHFLDRQMLQI